MDFLHFIGLMYIGLMCYLGLKEIADAIKVKRSDIKLND